MRMNITLASSTNGVSLSTTVLQNLRYYRHDKERPLNVFPKVIPVKERCTKNVQGFFVIATTVREVDTKDFCRPQIQGLTS